MNDADEKAVAFWYSNCNFERWIKYRFISSIFNSTWVHSASSRILEDYIAFPSQHGLSFLKIKDMPPWALSFFWQYQLEIGSKVPGGPCFTLSPQWIRSTLLRNWWLENKLRKGKLITEQGEYYRWITHWPCYEKDDVELLRVSYALHDSYLTYFWR